MKKKLFTLIACVLVLLSLVFMTACGDNSTTTVDNEKPIADSEEPIVIKMAHSESEDRSLHTAFLKFKGLVEKASNGRMQVDIYPNAQLGGDKDMLEGVQLNTIQITSCGASALSSFDDKFGVLDLPFLFDDYDEMTTSVCEGPLGELYASYCEEYGFKLLGYAYDGARSISNNIRPIYTVEDVKGLKLRVMETNVYISLMNAFGANPTPMSFSELYTAMAQGVVDGQDNPPSLGYTNKFHEVQKYYSWTRHSFQNSPLLISKKFYNSLDEDLQQIIADAGKQICTEQREEEHAAETEYETLIEESENCSTNEVTNRDTFKEAAKVVYDDYRKLVGDDVMNEVLEAAGKVGVY